MVTEIYAPASGESALLFCDVRVYRGGGFLPGVSSSKVAVGHILLFVVLKNELGKSYAPFKSSYHGNCARIFDVEKNMIHSNGLMKIDFV